VSSGNYTLIGTIGGGIVGSLVPGVGTLAGARIGATLGALADGLTAQDTAKVRDARWSGATYGTAIQRGWNRNRTDCAIIWALRNANGTYLFEHEKGKGKKGGGTETHYHASFAFLVGDTGFTFPDGTQVERAIIPDRLWAADKIVWQSESAAPISLWFSGHTYDFGDYVQATDGHVYSSAADE